MKRPYYTTNTTKLQCSLQFFDHRLKRDDGANDHDHNRNRSERHVPNNVEGGELLLHQNDVNHAGKNGGNQHGRGVAKWR